MSQDRAIDAKLFWTALGARAIGVAIVTAAHHDEPAGFLALSATHVTADPPLTLVSIDKRTSALANVLGSRHFAINYVSAADAELANLFGGGSAPKGAERFNAERWTTLATGAPILRNCVGAIDCRLEDTIERYGVVIAIGRVVDFVANADVAPLIHFRGKYM
jgi:flavin reductase (DIM6/NTAB) family NADH-FMN oxidoreductase RutF